VHLAIGQRPRAGAARPEARAASGSHAGADARTYQHG